MAISIDVTTFDLVHVNDLTDDVVVEVDVEEALKSSIFIVQKAAAPKSGVEFLVNFYHTEGCRTKIWRRISPGFHWYHQKLSSYVVRRLATSPTFDQSEAEKLSQTDR